MGHTLEPVTEADERANGHGVLAAANQADPGGGGLLLHGHVQGLERLARTADLLRGCAEVVHCAVRSRAQSQRLEWGKAHLYCGRCRVWSGVSG